MPIPLGAISLAIDVNTDTSNCSINATTTGCDLISYGCQHGHQQIINANTTETIIGINQTLAHNLSTPNQLAQSQLFCFNKNIITNVFEVKINRPNYKIPASLSISHD